jgi:hypothetical protein
MRQFVDSEDHPHPSRGPWADLLLLNRHGRLLAGTWVGDVGAWTEPAE